MAECVVEKHANMTRRRQNWRLVLAFLCAAGLIWGGWTTWTGRNYRHAIAQIEAEMASSRFGTAARMLNELLARNPNSDEACYLLGICEQKQGRRKPAADALARVTPGSAFSHQAILARMRLFHDSGRFADAEQIIIDSAEDPRNERTGLRVLLVPIYSQLGRLDETQRLIEDQWEHLQKTGQGASERAIDLVRMHIEINLKPNPIENVRTYLDQALHMAPKDDRVWLGRANLAIRTRDYDEAKLWLDACLKSRPEDLPVWRCRLRWGMATNRIDVVQQSLAHLPAEESTLAELHRLTAWLASQRGDVKTERRELEHLIAADPADLTALDRLIQLAENDGQPAQAAELVRRKAEIDRQRARYETLYDRKQPIRDAVEMARLAERLGRAFEARVFLTLAISAAPEREDLRHDLERLSRSSATGARRGQTMADVLALELANERRIRGPSSR
jgi:tetratricopeptide (TPR) repeat protein